MPGLLCDPRVPGDGSRTFHFGVDVVAPGGAPVYAVAPGRLSGGSPADVAQNRGVVVVQATGQKPYSGDVLDLVVGDAVEEVNSFAPPAAGYTDEHDPTRFSLGAAGDRRRKFEVDLTEVS